MVAHNVGGISATITLRNNEFKTKLAESKRKVEEFKQSTADASKSVKAMGKSSTDSAKGVGKLAQSSERAKKSIDGIQKGSAIAFGGIALGIGLATKSAADFEQSLADVSAVTGSTKSEMEALSKQALTLSENSAYSSSEIAGAAGELVKAGLSMKQVLGGGLKGALDLATAGELDMAQAAQIASVALNSFKRDNLTVSKAADILAGAANASATSVGELQQGLAQSSAVAAQAGLSFQDTVTALGMFSNAGLKGSDSGTSLKTMLQRLTPTTKDATKEMEKLGIITKDGSNQFYDAQGNLKSLAEVTDILHNSLKDLNPEQRGKELQELFGSDAMRGAAILFENTGVSVKDFTDQMLKISAADVAAKKLDTLKGSFKEFQHTLENLGITIGEAFLPSFRKIVDGAQDFTQVLGDLNPQVLEMGLVGGGAAAGLALIATSIIKVVRSLRLLYAGLGPTGWVIMGLSVVAGLFAASTVSIDENSVATLKNIEAQRKQNEALRGSIDQFDQLRQKSSLTTAEFGRFLDITSEINKTTDPAKLKALRDEQAQLAKKSGLTNGELSKMVSLNSDLTQKVPGSTKEITEQGNRIAGTTDKMKGYVAELDKMNERQTFEAYAKAEAKVQEATADLIVKQHKLNDAKAAEKDLEGKLSNYSQEKVDKEKEHYRAILMSGTATDAEVANASRMLGVLDKGKGYLYDQLATQQKKTDEIQRGIDKDNTEIQQAQVLKSRLADIYLKQVGINGAKGDAIGAANQEIDKLNTQKSELDALYRKHQINTTEYQDQVGKIDNQIGKLQGVKQKLNEIGYEASKPATKKVNVDVSPNISTINAQLAHTIYKDVITRYHETGVNSMGQARAYTDQLRRHQGGTLPKFHEGGSPALRQFAITPPMSTEIDARLLRNEMVLTEGQQANLFAMIKTPSMAPAKTSSESGPTSTNISNFTINVDAKDFDEMQKVVMFFEGLPQAIKAN